MATKKICDRCGEEINPKESMVKLEVRDYRDQPLTDRIVTELCCSCSFHLRKWLNGGSDNAPD
jgi:hypothetical protein